MSEVAERYERIAAGFTERVTAVSPDAWDNLAPCEGWVARDVVGHLVEWVPSFFFTTWSVAAPPVPSVDDDPAAAWSWLDGLLRSSLDSPIADEVRETPIGPSSFAAALDQICTPDVLIHTWDLARATGLDERLDPDAVHRMLEGMSSMPDELMRSSGQFGPRVAVADDADEQTRLIAFLGRQP